MTLTDLSTTTLPQALGYTSRFGLNRSQGIYFYQIVLDSPPETYVADLKHISQPSPTSLLGRLLRESCGTLPQLMPQEPVHRHSQSRRAMCTFEMKYGPSPVEPPNDQVLVSPNFPLRQRAVNKSTHPPKSPIPLSIEDYPSFASVTTVRASTSPPPVAPNYAGFATTPVQPPLSMPLPNPLLQGVLNLFGAHQCTEENTNIQPSNNTHIPQAHQDPTNHSQGVLIHPEPIQQDEQESLPFSPMLLSDDNMDILRDTSPAPPSYNHTTLSEWDMVPEYVIAPPLYSNSLATPQPASVWQAPGHDLSPATHYNTGFTTPNAAIDDWIACASVSATPHLANSSLPAESSSHPCPMVEMSDSAQDLVHQHESHPASTHGTSMRAIPDDFERSLTLVADEHMTTIQIKDTDAPLTMLDITQLNDDDPELDTSSLFGSAGSTPDRSPAFRRDFEEDENQSPTCFLDLSPSAFKWESSEPLEELRDDPPPLVFQREGTEPVEEKPSCLSDLSDELLSSLKPTSADPVSQSSSVSGPSRRSAHPFIRLRSPTPLSHRRTTLGPTQDTSTSKCITRQLARLLAQTEDIQEQASFQANWRGELQALLGGRRVLQPLHGCTRETATQDMESGARGRNMRRTASATILGAPPVRRGGREWAEGEGEGEKDDCREHRNGNKRTRFIVPDFEDDPTSNALAARRRIRLRKATGEVEDTPSGPNSSGGRLRSILRKKRAARRSSIP